jgi:hypothetical protein
LDPASVMQDMRVDAAMDLLTVGSDVTVQTLDEQLDGIERILLWLPRNEPRRPILCAKLAETRTHLRRSSGADTLLHIRACVRELRPSSLRTLLLKRIDALCRILIFPDLGMRDRTASTSKLAS